MAGEALVYSKASDYAIRALVHLARCPSRTLVRAVDIAKTEKLPPLFLAKTLQGLVRQRLLKSSRGRGGAFQFWLDPKEICLRDVVRAVDGIPCYEQCAMGRQRCSVEDACPMHEGWAGLRSQIVQYLQQTTIAGLASAPDARRNWCGLPRLSPNAKPKHISNIVV